MLDNYYSGPPKYEALPEIKFKSYYKPSFETETERKLYAGRKIVNQVAVQSK